MIYKNKKGFFPGWEYVAAFFILAIMFVFVVGIYDFTLEEVYEPVHSTLDNSMQDLGVDSGAAYQGFQDNYIETKNKDLPFNLLYIFIFFYTIIISLINVAKEKKLDPMGLVFKTIGGMVFFLYLMQIVILKIVTYFKLQVIDYLFQDLIVSYIPFYLVTYDNAGIIMLIWGVALILDNWYFGKTEQEFSGVFGQ